MKLIINILIFYLLFFTSCTECNHCEIVKAYYADWVSVKKAKPADREWLPPIIGVKTENIREQHDLDTNRVWGSATYSQEIKNFKDMKKGNSKQIISMFKRYALCFNPNFEENMNNLYYYSKDKNDATFVWLYAINPRTKVIYFMNCLGGDLLM